MDTYFATIDPEQPEPKPSQAQEVLNILYQVLEVKGFEDGLYIANMANAAQAIVAHYAKVMEEGKKVKPELTIGMIVGVHDRFESNTKVTALNREAIRQFGWTPMTVEEMYEHYLNAIEEIAQLKAQLAKQ
jgi:hypothetical protein